MLGKWPKWFWIPICRVSESGNVARERKDSLLIHASISTMFSLFHFYHLVFFCSLVLSFFLTLLSVCVPPYLWLPLFLLYCLILWDFSLCPKASPTIFGFLWASLQDCPLTCWLPCHYLCSKCACYTTLHPQKKFLVMFLSFLNFYLPEWIRIGGSLYTYLYDMHQVAPTLCLPLLGEMSS